MNLTEEKIIQKLFNLFNPREPLGFDQLNLFVERPKSPLPGILRGLSLRPSRILLSGQVGTGKSSELRALIPRLTDNFTAFYIDLEKTLNLGNTHRVEVLIAVGLGAYKAACKAFEAKQGVKERPDERVAEKLAEPIREVVEKTRKISWVFEIGKALQNIAAIAVGLISPDMAPLAPAIATFPSFFALNLDAASRQEVEKEDTALEVARRVSDVLTDIAEKSERRLLLIVDGTDKISLEAAQDLFIGRLLTELKCSMVWLMPLELSYRPIAQQATPYFELEGIPNITVHEEPNRSSEETIWQERSPIPEAIEALSEMVRRRIKACGLQPGEIIDEEALKYLARMSGGVVRHLMMLMEKCLLAIAQGAPKISLEMAKQEVQEVRLSFESRLWKEDYDLMLEVLQTGEIPQGVNPELVDNLIKSCFILGYRNKNFWWDIHPILLSSLQAHRRKR